MFNSLQNLVITGVNNYANFWDKTLTIQRAGAHAITLIPVIAFRLGVHANPANIAYIHELMAVLGLVSHIFVAIAVGGQAPKRLGLGNVNEQIAQSLKGLEEQIKLIRGVVRGRAYLLP